MFAAEWTSIQQIPPAQKVEITTRNLTRTGATFVSATAEAILVRDQSGERSIQRADILQVRVWDPSRRTRNGLIGMLAGAGLGALFFLRSTYRTVYKGK